MQFESYFCLETFGFHFVTGFHFPARPHGLPLGQRKKEIDKMETVSGPIRLLSPPLTLKPPPFPEAKIGGRGGGLKHPYFNGGLTVEISYSRQPITPIDLQDHPRSSDKFVELCQWFYQFRTLCDS